MMCSTYSCTESVSEIAGSPDMYVESGSDVNLVCSLRNYTMPPPFVFWYQGRHMINHEKRRRVSSLRLCFYENL